MHTEPAPVREAALRRYARNAGIGATFESAAIAAARPSWEPLLESRADKADDRRFTGASITDFGVLA